MSQNQITYFIRVFGYSNLQLDENHLRKNDELLNIIRISVHSVAAKTVVIRFKNPHKETIEPISHEQAEKELDKFLAKYGIVM